MLAQNKKLRRVRLREFSDLENLSIGNVIEIKTKENENSDWVTYEGIIDDKYAFMQQNEDCLREILSWRCPKKFITIGNYSEIVINYSYKDLEIYTSKTPHYKEKVKLLKSAKMWEDI